MRFGYKLILIFTVLVAVVLSSLVFADEYCDTLRVGIYYGSTAVSDANLTSDTGFSVGIFTSDRSFIPVLNIANTSVRAEKDMINGEAAYHVDYSSHASAEEAAFAAEELRSQGIDVFPGYINSEFHVLGGSFKNHNDALWAAENLAVKGTPYASSAKSLKLSDSSGKLIFLVDNSSNGLNVYSSDYENADALLGISGSAKGTYRGGFEFKVGDDGLITVVNTVSTEAYLYSVVSREMSPSWEIEALKAQAVCARNFALGRINYHKKYGFDVCRTVCCQAYATTADHSESVHKAVDETYGELLFYEDKPIQAVYSSSMGARTESVENVWGTPFPYLVSVENPYEDTDNIYNGKWTKTLTKTRVTEIMAAHGADIGTVTDITVLERTPAGGVLKLKVSGTNGSKTYEKESCRTVFSEATYSQRYTVTTGGQSVHPQISISDGKTQKTVSTSSVSVLGGNNSLSTLKNGCYASGGSATKHYTTVQTSGDADTFIFSGEGWGHGVGMSQYGAKGMAMAGFDYEDILTHYYTGTTLKKVY